MQLCVLCLELEEYSCLLSNYETAYLDIIIVSTKRVLNFFGFFPNISFDIRLLYEVKEQFVVVFIHSRFYCNVKDFT